MASKRYTVRYRRKRAGSTDYRKRLSLLLAEKPRFVFRKSLNSTVAQFVIYEASGDLTKVSVNSKELVKAGWNYSGSNMPSAYLVGYLCGLKAVKAGIKEAIFDTGLLRVLSKSVVYSALKGCVDAGVKIPHNAKILPSDDDVAGKRIQDYAKLLLSEDKPRYDRQFSGYIKKGVKPEEIMNAFKKIKEALSKK
jgi:large subunit ribosomal protein L18